MQFVDTHTHLYMDDYSDGCGNAVQRAIEAGVTKMILPDVDSKAREKMFSLAEMFPLNTFPCLGLHPTEITENWKSEIDALMEHKGRKDIVAIGETGMDCHWTKDTVREQEEVFRTQLDLAIELGLPVIIHSREATEITLRILGDYKGKGLRGVFHAYGGSIETFREIEKLGDWYVGIGGVVTFKKASIAETVKEIPIERILTETDAPWLAPVPFRGQRNESSYIPHIAQKIAEQKGLDMEKVAAVTWENAHKLFRI